MEHCKLRCHKCSREYPVGNHSLCPECGGILTLEYTDEYLRNLPKSRPCSSLWDYRELLPPVKDENIVSFREGGTPLVKSVTLGEKWGLNELYFKNETCNPTGSFKDRAVSVCISMAKEFECPGVVVSSSGNGGASVSAYGMKGGMHPLILIPEKTPVGKVAQAVAAGGRVVKVKGNFSDAYHAALDLSQKTGAMNATTTFLNPYGLEGYKTILYEILEQLKKVPDYIFVPVGAGPALYGIHKACEELVRAEKLRRIPRLVCVQAKGCSPIVKAWERNEKVSAWKDPHTIASAISDPLDGYEQDGDMTIEAIRKSRGYALAVTDEKLLETGRALAGEEGLFVEPTSAAAVAAAGLMAEKGLVKQGDLCVCLLTGHGLKDSGAYVPEDLEVKVIAHADEL